MLLHIVIFIAGLVVLYYGAEWLVKGSSRLALSFGIRPVVVGLTVVAFGTSCPEFFVSFASALKHSSGIAIGNIVGSNIANVGLVVGAAALVRPMAADRQILVREMPFMLAVSLLFWALVADGVVGRLDGAIFVAGIIGFTGLSIYFAMKQGKHAADVDGLEGKPGGGRAGNLGLTVVGLAGLVLGAHLMVTGAVFIARVYHISEVVIGLSVVAIGTSLPELAASMVAAAHGEADLSIGNVIGSNIFNILFVIGVVSLIAPLPVERETIRLQMPAMIGFSAVMYFFMAIRRDINRIEGFLLLAAYVAFIVWVYL